MAGRRGETGGRAAARVEARDEAERARGVGRIGAADELREGGRAVVVAVERGVGRIGGIEAVREFPVVGDSVAVLVY